MEDLTQEQIEEIVAALEQQQASITQQLQQSKASTKPIDLNLPIGRLSRMDAMQQQKMAQASRRNQEVRLKQTQTALATAKKGDLGYCRRCDESIGIARLRARPESPFCIDCQSSIEKRR